jgi:hypothetical protein
MTNGGASLGTSSYKWANVYANNLYGSLTGNASTATTLATARTIAISDGATGTATSFNGSKNISIPITSVKEAYLDWGGKDLAGKTTLIDAAMVNDLSANRLAFSKPAGIKIEYQNSTTGSNWVSYEDDADTTYQANKVKLVSGLGSAFYIGHKSSSKATPGVDKLRITLNASTMGTYFLIRKFLIHLSTSGAADCKM